MATEDPLFRLRMPQELKDQLAELAKSNHRSLNAELLHRIEMTMSDGLLQAKDAKGKYKTPYQKKVLKMFSGLTREQQQAVLILLKSL